MEPEGTGFRLPEYLVSTLQWMERWRLISKGQNEGERRPKNPRTWFPVFMRIKIEQWSLLMLWPLRIAAKLVLVL